MTLEYNMVALCPNFEVVHLYLWGSDHRVIEVLLDSRKGAKPNLYRSFRFEYVFQENKCFDIISSSWE